MEGRQTGESRALEILMEILSSERLRTSAHFSSEVYADEPILKTGRQMRSFLPERYRQMKDISRWQKEGADGRGRWLSEAELFWRQARFMEDFEDDCPYHGEFKAYYPTYDAMSDLQLRGYFTWRARVRRGDVQQSSLSFAYVYLYELINGIGVESPLEGFGAIGRFWQSYRGFAPELDQHVPRWLQDYAVYHGLDRSLLAADRDCERDRAYSALKRATAKIAAAGGAGRGPSDGRRRGQRAPSIPLPPDAALEDELFGALDALSSYRMANSRLYKARPDDVRHVTCAVFVRLCAYYEKNRAKGLIESWFGELAELPYTMFGAAVFFEPERHPDAVYELDEVHRYRCRGGMWTCERLLGEGGRNRKLGSLLRAVDRSMRAACDFPHKLKDDGKTPKYLQKIIDEETAAWQGWQEAHAPVLIEIDLGQLEGIRSAAAATREALLVDEEREGAPSGKDAGTDAEGNAEALEAAFAMDAPERTERRGAPGRGDGAPGRARRGGTVEDGALAVPTAPDDGDASGAGGAPTSVGTAAATAGRGAGAEPSRGGPGRGLPLSAAQAAYLCCLVEGAPEGARREAVLAGGLSEDMLADAVNEALFALVGDTVIEFGADGPALVEDYRTDVEELMAHG